jgi:segregation and condensation protein B
MDREEAKRVLEVILFVADKPLAASKLTEIVKGLDADTIKACVDELNGEYATGGRTFSIKEIAGGYQILTDPIYSQWVAAYYKRPAEKLRGPALETLSIIAYKQPITRSQCALDPRGARPYQDARQDGGSRKAYPVRDDQRISAAFWP